VTDLAQAFDPVWGGFSRAPKFPRLANCSFCCAKHSVSAVKNSARNAQARDMALFSLRRMRPAGCATSWRRLLPLFGR